VRGALVTRRWGVGVEPGSHAARIVASADGPGPRRRVNGQGAGIGTAVTSRAPGRRHPAITERLTFRAVHRGAARGRCRPGSLGAPSRRLARCRTGASPAGWAGRIAPPGRTAPGGNLLRLLSNRWARAGALVTGARRRSYGTSENKETTLISLTRNIGLPDFSEV